METVHFSGGVHGPFMIQSRRRITLDWDRSIAGKIRAQGGQQSILFPVSTESIASFVAIMRGAAIFCRVTDSRKLADTDLSHNARRGLMELCLAHLTSVLSARLDDPLYPNSDFQ